MFCCSVRRDPPLSFRYYAKKKKKSATFSMQNAVKFTIFSITNKSILTFLIVFVHFYAVFCTKPHHSFRIFNFISLFLNIAICKINRPINKTGKAKKWMCSLHIHFLFG